MNIYDIVKTYSENTLGKFSKHDALVACPSLGSSSVESALKKLVDEGTVIRTGAGRKNIKKLMINGELVIEWKKEKSIKDVVMENICYD